VLDEWLHSRLFELHDYFTALHQISSVVRSNEIQLNPDDGSTILNQIDLGVDFDILHFETTNAYALRRINFPIEMGMTMKFELSLVAQKMHFNNAMDGSNVLLLHWGDDV
jgi:hypothetical protein